MNRYNRDAHKVTLAAAPAAYQITPAQAQQPPSAFAPVDPGFKVKAQSGAVIVTTVVAHKAKLKPTEPATKRKK